MTTALSIGPAISRFMRKYMPHARHPAVKIRIGTNRASALGTRAANATMNTGPAVIMPSQKSWLKCSGGALTALIMPGR